jgi:hypothetical protein
MLINVKLPLTMPSKEEAHLTRFQTECPPHWQGKTLLGIQAQPADSVSSLKAKVAGARPISLLRYMCRHCAVARAVSACAQHASRQANSPKSRHSLGQRTSRACFATCSMRLPLTSH